MTVSTSYSPLTWSGNGSTTAFSITWPFFTGTLVVTLISSTGVETVKSLTTHCTVSGGTDSDGLPATGTVTMLTAPASGETLRVERVTPKSQASTWSESDSFPQKVVEAALDRLTLIAQENSGGGGSGVNGAALQLDTTGAVDFYDAGTYPVRSSATPLDDDDLVSKSYADDNYGATAAAEAAASAAAAAASETAAEAAETSAVAAAATATTKAAEASASATSAASNSSSPCFTVKWSTNTAASDPGSTYIKGNNASLGSITTLYLSETVIEGAIGGFETAMFNGASSGSPAAFALIKPGSRTNYIAGTVTGHTDSGTYRTLTFAVGSSSGSFSADDILVMIITPAVTSSITALGLATAAFGPFTSIASASTTDLSTVVTVGVNITGTTTITSFGTGTNLLRVGKFAAALTLTHNATSLILPGGANITTAAGDTFTALSDGSGNWTVTSYVRASGLPVRAVSGSSTAVQKANGSGALTDAAATDLGAGTHTIYVPSGAMISRTTNGAASGTVETTTNKVMLSTLDFDTTTQEFAQFSIRMPKSWNESTVTARFTWSHASTTTNFGVVWALEAVALSDDDAGDTAFGTAQQIADTGGTTNDIYVTSATPAITIGGSPAAEDWVVFQVKRVPSDGSDTMAIDARLHGVTLYITTDAINDA